MNTDLDDLEDRFISYLRQYMVVDATLEANARDFFLTYVTANSLLGGMSKNPEWNTLFSYLVCDNGGEPEGREACTWYLYFMNWDPLTSEINPLCPATGGGNI